MTMLKITKAFKALSIALIIAIIATIIAPVTSFTALAGENNSDSIKRITHKIIDEKIIFTVTTSAGEYNRLRCGLSPSTKDNLETVNSYTVNSDGDYVWTIKTDAPTEETYYVFDLRSSETGKYIKDYYFYEVTELGETLTIKNVTYGIEDGKIHFTVTTSEGNYSRLRCGLSTSTKDNLATANSYTIDSNGDYVWNLYCTAPTADTKYVFDLRDAETNKYIKEYFYFNVNIIDATDYDTITDEYYVSGDGVFKFYVGNLATLESSGCICFNLDNNADLNERSSIYVSVGEKIDNTLFSNLTKEVFDRYFGYETKSVTKATIKDTPYTIFCVELDENISYYVFQTADRCYVIKVTAIGSAMHYAKLIGSKIMDSIVVMNYEAPANITYAGYVIVNGKIYISVETSSGNFNRLRCGLSTSTKDTIAVADSFTTTNDGNYQWDFVFDAPTEDTTLVFDLRSAETGKYIKEYYYLDVNVIDETDYNTIVDGYYVSEDGGFKFLVGDWEVREEFSGFLTAVSNEPDNQKSALLVNILDAVDSETFENITKEDFDKYFDYESEKVTKSKISGTDVTIYRVEFGDVCDYHFFQANGVCYSIQIAGINSTKDEAAIISDYVSSTIIILK